MQTTLSQDSVTFGFAWVVFMLTVLQLSKNTIHNFEKYICIYA